MYQENEKKIAAEIREAYEDRGETKIEKLIKLHKKVKRPAEIFSFSFGIIGSLILGLGMCLAMKVIGNLMPLGIVVGCIGIVMVSVNYLLYKKIEKSRKKEYSEQILKITDEMIAH